MRRPIGARYGRGMATFPHWIISRSNPIMRPLAGRRLFPLWAVLHHRGRSSGRDYATPIVARRTRDGFVIPMPFGEATQWSRNVEAAGAAAIRWRGADYAVERPREIDLETARPAFGPVLGRLLRLAGIERFIEVHDALSTA